MAQPKVFISHSHVDDAFAERLVKDLRAAGADAWLDKEELGAGDFQERIDAALASCEWFLLVLTRSALASPWVQQEVRAANRLKHQKRVRDLIFIQAGPVAQNELPPLWGVFNILDATVDYRAALHRALKAVGLSPQVAPTSTPPTANGSGSLPAAAPKNSRPSKSGVTLVRPPRPKGGR